MITGIRPISDQGWGLVTAARIPGGIELGLYEPRHATALALAIEEAGKQRDRTG